MHSLCFVDELELLAVEPGAKPTFELLVDSQPLLALAVVVQVPPAVGPPCGTRRCRFGCCGSPSPFGCGVPASSIRARAWDQ